MKKFLLAATVVAVSVSVFAFEAGQSTESINQEIATRVANGESLESIASLASAAGLNPTTVQVALQTASGKPSTEVFNAMVAGGVDPGRLVAPTAAGNANTANTNTNTNTNSSLGNTNFTGSRGSSVTGGGSGSVSPS
jgi:hypothetical protein